MRIFLSYANEQAPLAERIAAVLRNEAHDVFIDKRDLPPGASFTDRIREAIHDSDVFVFLASREALGDRRYTLTELSIAEERWPEAHRGVLPVIVDDTPPRELPPYLAAVSVLVPKGDIASEVAAAVARRPGVVSTLKALSRTRWFRPFAALTLAALLAVGAWIYVAEAERREQAAIETVLAEMAGNATVLSELQKNTQTLVGLLTTVQEVLRHPRIEMLSGLFPPENADPASDEAGLSDLYNQRMEWLEASGLLQDAEGVGRFQAACSAITRTIDKTETTVDSLADLDGSRYVVRDAEWQAQRERIRDSTFTDRIPRLLARLRTARLNYDRVARLVPEYLAAVHAFCAEPIPSRPGLSAALASERLTARVVNEYVDQVDTLQGELSDLASGGLQ